MELKDRFGVVVLFLLASFLITNAEAQVNVTKPVKLSVIDVAGNLQLSKMSIEAFKEANPKLVADIEYLKLTAPELPSKIKAQQMAGNLDTTLVLTGYDAMASGIEQEIYEQLMPAYKEAFQKTVENYLPGAKAAYNLFKEYGIAYVFCPGGPMFTYNPEKVPIPPKTPPALLAWAKANPGKFLYARPANSGPGRAFLQGLPYILGDRDPKDSKTWDKTWAFLKELDKYIDYYPSGTAITFKELSEGTRWIIASHLGWDMNQRILATIPANYQGFFLDNTTWVSDCQFMAIPKGLDKERLEVTIELMKWLMTPAQQAMTYDNAYFYPGPSIKGVRIDMAPTESQRAIMPAIRTAYEQAILKLPSTTQLSASALVDAMDTWDQLVGAKVK
jgi:putative spermidine/putrescine transport system substrate-binding protein